MTFLGFGYQVDGIGREGLEGMAAWETSFLLERGSPFFLIDDQVEGFWGGMNSSYTLHTLHTTTVV